MGLVFGCAVLGVVATLFVRETRTPSPVRR
jgi:hypothetical protein